MLTGRLVSHDGARAVIDVRDVGYVVYGPARDVAAWAGADGPVTLHVSTDVREDAITLYGFSDDLDRVAFERLRKVNGVGPKVALAALDTFDLPALVAAIESDDTKTLARISGVGKKLAGRLALELKGKLPASAFHADVASQGAKGSAPAAPAATDPLDLALDKLGYTRAEIGRAHAALKAQGLGADTPVAERIRAALTALSSR